MSDIYCECLTCMSLHLPGQQTIDQTIDRLETQIEKYKIALADAVRRPMGIVPDSVAELLTASELHAAECRRINKAVLDKPCAECGKIVGNDYEYGENDADSEFIVCGECFCREQEAWSEFINSLGKEEI